MRMKTLLAVCSALSLAGALSVTVPAVAQDRGGDHGGDRGGDRGGDHRGGNGGAVAAGVLGVVLGAAIADSADHRAYYQQHANDNAWHDRCAARYHSYDRGSGTYLGRDGHRHYCHL